MSDYQNQTEIAKAYAYGQSMTAVERRIITRHVAKVDEIIDMLVEISLRQDGEEIPNLLAVTEGVLYQDLDEDSVAMVAARAIQRLAQNGGAS